MFRSSIALAAVLGLVLATVPLLAVHGVESALALGLFLPPLCAATGASYTRQEAGSRGIDLMFRAIGAGLVIWAIPVILLALSSLRVRQCAPGEGLAFMVLGPAVGCALGSAVGVWVGGALRGASWAPSVAAAVPIAAASFGLWTFYVTPTVYVFGAFAGYFPGAIYDDLVRIPGRYMTYRAAILIATLALVVLFDAAWEPSTRSLAFRRRMPARFGTVLAGVAALAIVLVAYWNGDGLGHWVTEASLIERLGKTEMGAHCVVHMPRETKPEDAARLLSDCDFHVERIRGLSGMQSKEPVVAYVFRNQHEKKELIGVGRTLVAKPWRREIYVQMDRWPHPVLGHEVVHAVLGEAGRGPFAVAATLAGLIPNPGIVEGAAVALAWDIRDDLDPDQWSKIMRDRNELPRAKALMSVKFSGLPARRAYMASGSLIRFLIASRGMDAFVAAYGDGRIAELDELEADWHAYLDTVDVSEHERGVAEVALARSSIFTSVCPHALAKLRADLSGDAAARDDARMLQTCRAILDIDQGEARARAALIGALARSGERESALAELDGLRAAVAAPKPIVASALEAYADASWSLGRYDEAAALYEELLALPRTDGPARQAEVKRLALNAPTPERELIYQMLIERAPSPVVVHLAQALAEIREDGLGQYLEARQLLGQRRYALALPLLEEAERLGLPTPRLERERSRLLGVTLFALGRYEESSEVWSSRAQLSRAAGAEAARWLERVEYAETGSLSPSLPGPSSARRASP
jgi:tetratricopeptide (TPR) repeat protein